MYSNKIATPEFSFPYHTGDISNPVFNLWSFKENGEKSREGLMYLQNKYLHNANHISTLKFKGHALSFKEKKV